MPGGSILDDAGALAVWTFHDLTGPSVRRTINTLLAIPAGETHGRARHRRVRSDDAREPANELHGLAQIKAV